MGRRSKDHIYIHAERHMPVQGQRNSSNFKDEENIPDTETAQETCCVVLKFFFVFFFPPFCFNTIGLSNGFTVKRKKKSNEREREREMHWEANHAQFLEKEWDRSTFRIGQWYTTAQWYTNCCCCCFVKKFCANLNESAVRPTYLYHVTLWLKQPMERVVGTFGAGGYGTLLFVQQGPHFTPTDHHLLLPYMFL